MAYSAFTIANEFIRLSNAEGFGITHLKLQKLLYFSQAWYLALNGKPLFLDQIQAWKYGPVVPSVYEKFKIYGNDPISYCNSSIENLDDPTKQYIKQIWDLYKSVDAITLSAWSHEKEGPWDISKKYYQEIPIDLIQSYFTEKLNNPEA